MKTSDIKGFTLIEVMVAVAIFAVIASIIFPAMIQFLSVRERLEEKHDHMVGMQKTFLFLAKDMRFASNRLGKDEYGELGKATLSVDDGSLIEFTAQYPDLNLGGLSVPRRVRWQLEDGVLQRIQYPVMDPDSDTRSLRQNLMTEVDKVEVQLSFVEDGRDNTSSKWDEESRLPDMISVRVIMQNDIEYHRIFTMLAGDSVAALAASSVTNQP